MQLKTIRTIYFLGIGGIGMSALARYFASEGYRVMGYDRTHSSITEALEKEGIAIQYDDRTVWVESLDSTQTLVVRTPAVPEDEAIYCYFRTHGFSIYKRAEVLGWLTKQKKALCIAGTHGKTTTSTMLAHILHGSQLGINAFLGGIANNYGTNLLMDKRSEYVVVEADEFDRSFHQLSPYISIITSMDPDHLDIYNTEEAYCESFAHYASLVRQVLVVKSGLKEKLDLWGERLKAKVYTYAVSEGEKADFYATHVRVEDGKLWFDFHTPGGVIYDMELGVPALVNVENSVAAMAVAWLIGVSEKLMREGLRSFLGVYRRFNIHLNTPHIAYIDDYAHHPKELEATIASIRNLYPNRYMIGVFQPHLYSRTRDFATEFANALSMMDELVLLPIYPAREKPIEGVTSENIRLKVESIKPMVAKVVEKSELVAYLRKRRNEINSPCVVATMGAGDIDRCVNEITKNIL